MCGLHVSGDRGDCGTGFACCCVVVWKFSNMISQSREELLSWRPAAPTIARRICKLLFTLRLWRPRCARGIHTCTMRWHAPMSDTSRTGPLHGHLTILKLQSVTLLDTIVKSTMTGTVSSGRGRTAAVIAQNEQMAEKHSTLKQQPPGRLDHPAWRAVWTVKHSEDADLNLRWQSGLWSQRGMMAPCL